MLDLQVQCSEQLLVLALGHLPALEELVLRLASPHALCATFFQKFVAMNSDAGNPSELAVLPGRPLCAALRGLRVHYKRWLRGPERKTLIPIFSEIVSSRWSEEEVLRLMLSFDGLSQCWKVQKPVENIRDAAADYDISVIVISSQYGIIPLAMFTFEPSPLTEVPFKEAEYLVANHQLPIGCLLPLHNLVELRVGENRDILPMAPPPNLPLFRTLRVLTAKEIHPSFLAGQTFHRLERCRVSLRGEGPNLSQGQVTQLPVCTRLDVEDLTLLATFKLPQIGELGVSIAHPDFNMIWEKHIAVSANVSGLELLHVYGWNQQADLIQMLGCLPALKSLIVGNGSDLKADFFGEFVPVHLNETAILMQPHNEGHLSAILCPMLRGLLIEGCNLT